MDERQLERYYFRSKLLLSATAILGLISLLLWGITYQSSTTIRVAHIQSRLVSVKQAQLEIANTILAVDQYSPLAGDRSAQLIRAAEKRASTIIAGLISTLSDANHDKLLSEIRVTKDEWINALEKGLPASPGKSFSPADTSGIRTLTGQLERQLSKLAEAVYHDSNIKFAGTGKLAALLVSTLILLLLLSGFLLYWTWHEVDKGHERSATALERAPAGTILRGNFIANACHELRNPLNSIMLWCHAALSDAELGAKARRGLEGIDQAARAQALMIDELLDVGRMEAGRLELDMQSLDLADVVAGAIESLRGVAEDKSIAVNLRIETQDYRVKGDPRRFKQVVCNLLSNAIKFSPSSGEVEVALGRENSRVLLTVSDRGAGIDRKSLPHVFESFWQAKDGQDRDGSFGLGLAIVKQVVAAHGGMVTARSDGIGQGATFEVSLPVAALAMSTKQPAGSSAIVIPARLDRETMRLDHYSILVVDDDVDVCDALEETLSTMGAMVAAATSAEVALALVEEVGPDLIISDLGMPVHDGLWFAREMRRREQTAHLNRRTPLLALTALGQTGDRMRAMQAGYDCHVAKPVKLAELVTIIREMLDGSETPHISTS